MTPYNLSIVYPKPVIDQTTADDAPTFSNMRAVIHSDYKGVFVALDRTRTTSMIHVKSEANSISREILGSPESRLGIARETRLGCGS